MALITLPALTSPATLSQYSALATQLVSAYSDHYKDATDDTGTSIIHWLDTNGVVGVPNIPISKTSTATSLLEVAQVLNELKKKHNWHVRSFRGHGVVGPDIVTAASIPSTELGPTFSDVAAYPAELLSLANTLRTSFNAHLADATEHASTFAGVVDTANTITLAAATDADSLVELTAHLYSAFGFHSKDANYPVYFLGGNTADAAPTKLTGVQAVDVAPYASVNHGYISDIYGLYSPFSWSPLMYVYPSPAFTYNNWPVGTYVSSVDAATTTITMSASHDSAGAPVETHLTQYYFSYKKYHNYQSATEPSPGSATLNSALLISDIVDDQSILYSMLLDIQAKYNYHDGGTGTYHSLDSLHQVLPTSGLSATAPVLCNYLYAFVYAFEYSTYQGSTLAQTFLDIGAPYLKTKTTLKPIESVASTITGIKAYTNGASLNYDTTNMVVKIYRSINNGTALYYVGSVPNGTTTFVDAVTDAELATREQLYTTGGVVDRDQPPRCKFLHMVNNFTYYGNIIDLSSGVAIPNRILQSVSDSPGAVPGDFFLDLPSAILGISSAREIPVAFTATGCYRIAGSVNELGTGSMDGVPISESIGLAGPWSLVKIEEGLVFAGTDGFYFTDGYKLQKLTKHWNTTYKNLVSGSQKRDNIVGAYDKLNRRVWWAVTSDNSLVNDKCFVLDLEYGLVEEACFTTASGSASFAPTALEFWQGGLLRGHRYGYVFKHDESILSDPKVDISASPASWANQAIIYDYLGTAYDGGTTTVRKKSTLLINQFGNFGSASIQPYCVDDLGRSQKNLTPIRYRGGLVWGDPQVVWGDPQYVWNSNGGTISEKRHFPGGSVNYMYRQIGFTNAKVVHTNSDVYGKATLNRAAKTLTLNSATLVFPNSMVDFVVAFENDEYVLEFTIASQTPTVLTLTDTLGLLPANGSYAWVIRGKPKGEFIQLLSYSMPVVLMGNSESDAGGESGGNA